MWPQYSKTCRSAVDDLLRAGGSLSAYKANPQVGVEPSKGSWAWRLERDIERRFRVNHAVLVNSGTAALHSALSALRLKPGDRVVTTPFSFSATSAAICLSGATPIYADIDPFSFNITPETVKPLLSRQVKAIVPVSLFGGMCDVEGLKQFGIPVIEDAAQAVGAKNKHGYSGTHALAGAYSMNGGKNIPAGECGAAVTNDPEIAHRMRLLMNHGENFGAEDVGLNYRPNELTACVAWHGLQELGQRNIRRRQLAYKLEYEALDLMCGMRPVGFPEYTREDHVFYVYPFTVKADRSKFIKRMAKHGIPVGAGYITPTLPHYKAFRKYARGPLPVVEELSSRTLCILSTLTPDRPMSYARKVAECMREALK